MTLVGPIALATLAKIAAAVGAAIVVAYILKLRRRRQEVPFSKLWQRVLGDRQSASLWHKLKRLLSLLLALTIAGLLLFAATGPELGQAKTDAHSVVVIVDASASMSARDDGASGPTRLDVAREKAKAVLSGLGGADAAMVIRLDGQPAPLSRFETDMPSLLRVVDGLRGQDSPADLPRALATAADALRGRPHPLIVIVGDGAYREEALAGVRWVHAPASAPVPAAPGTPAAPGDAAAAAATPALAPGLASIDLSGIDVAFVSVGKASRNVGIVAFNVRRYFENKLAYEVLAEMQNFGDEPEKVRFTLESGGQVIDVRELEIAPGKTVRKIYPDVTGSGDRTLTARIAPAPAPGGALRPPDAFALDDVAYALLPDARRSRVLLVSENLFLEGALLLDSNLTVDRITSAEYAAALAAGKVHQYDVAIFDGHTPPTLPPTQGVLYFKPSGDGAPIKSRGEIKRPFFTDEDENHPVMRWVTLRDVNVTSANVLVPQPGDEILASSIRDPLIVAGRRDGKKVVVVGFDLETSDLVMRVAFPVMLMNTLDWFAGGGAELVSTYRTGKVWNIPVDADAAAGQIVAKIMTPSSQKLQAPIDDGLVRFFGGEAGVYRIDVGASSVAIAANLSDPRESAIMPRDKLVLGGKELPAPPAFAASVTRSIWLWLALAVLGLLLVEWWTYNRRVTV